jgi:hypothetical protein
MRTANTVWIIATVLVVSVLLRAQMPPDPAPKPVFLQSFRQGHTRITEESFELDLDSANPGCKVRVRDSSGLSRYQVNCVPERVQQGDPRILGWHIRLVDLHHKIYDDLFLSTPNPAEDKLQIGWLDPGRFPKIALKAERTIKVDDFYCWMQVQDAHFGHPPEPYLDRIVVNLRFSNSDPRTSPVQGTQ